MQQEDLERDTKNDHSRWLLRFPRAVPIAAFLLIAAITLLSVVLIERSVADNERVSLDRTASSLSSTLERRATASASYLRAGAALFATTGQFSLSEFRRFVSELQLDRDYRGIDGIGWAPALSPDDVPEFESVMSARLGERLNVWPREKSDARGLIVPVRYLQPDNARNRRALGFDMNSEIVRRTAMTLAAQRAQPVASGRVRLKQEGTNAAAGFLIYMPVYDGQGRERRLKGYVYSPIRATEFLDAAVNEEFGDKGLSARFYNGAVADENLLAVTGEQQDVSEQVEMPVNIAGRTMTVVLTAPANAMLSPLSMIALLFGLFVGSLLMLVARLLTRRATEDQIKLNWFEEQSSIRNSLTRELNHRVKNTLANVLSIIALTRRRATEVPEFADGLAGRIRALSATHDLLTQSEWGTTPIRAVIDAELAPYANTGDGMVTRSGPEVELAPNDALSLGMAIHELATNAAKYGALSTSDGSVSVVWTLAGAGLAEIHWTETGGPPVPLSRGRGFGTELIEKVVAHELRHPVELDFHADGVRCKLLVPVRQPTEFALRAPSEGRPSP